MKTYAVTWLGSLPNRVEVAARVSPLTYVRAGLPPIISVHGDADPTVPYTHSVRLHEALKKVSVDGELVTVPGAGMAASAALRTSARSQRSGRFSRSTVCCPRSHS